MIIDASNLVLLGEKIEIVNCEQAYITGTKANIMEKYKAKRDRGDPFHGPYFPRQSERIVKRTIRGMLPYRQEKGLNAFKRVMCYTGVPDHLQKVKHETVKGANIDKMSNLKRMTIGEIAKLLGGRL